MSAPVPISAMAREIPPAPVLAILSRYRREDIECFIAIAIDLLDLTDGDPDVEANGDEHDGTEAEDEEGAHTHYAAGPGCEISDPGGCEHDGREQDDGL